MNDSSAPITRRQLLADSATLAAASMVATGLPASANKAPTISFRSAWQNDLDRPWLGAAYWAGPLQDWRVKGGRIECFNAAPGRNVQVLTVEHGGQYGTFTMSAKLGRMDGSPLGEGKGSAGFRIAILGTLGAYPDKRDYRNNLAFSSGLDAGITAQGGLFFGDVRKAKPGTIDLKQVRELKLELISEIEGNVSEAVLKLRASDAATQQVLGETTMRVPHEKLAGNLALMANYGSPLGQGGGKKAKKVQEEGFTAGNGAFWFSDWELHGSSLKRDDTHVFGPILFNHYSLSLGVMKMSVQLPPLGEKDNSTVALEVQRDGAWQATGKAVIHALARTAVFRIADWDATKDHAYRLVYALKFADGTEQVQHYEGTVRRDPTDKATLSVADISCNIHTAFPNTSYVANVGRIDPDLLAFVGDQFYENTAGFGIVTAPLESAAMDYLRKWYFHGWTWRELTKDRPSVSLPDDHDVYQGNLWGEGGAAKQTTQEAGGYELEPEWVNVVHRTQTSHHPDPWSKEPSKQGILNYYGPLTYGRVSFAVLADRQFKSGPEGKVPPTGDRGDHVTSLDFDPKTADIPGLELLGQGQMDFLKAWAQDWKGADMKAVISATIFTGMATTHGGPDGVLRADYDANGWPQSPRNAALREIRKAFAFHIAGDQHLPAVIHYGIDGARDAAVAFAGPAVNVGYPRWWDPSLKVNGRDLKDGLLGDFTDAFGHPMAVLAVKNGERRPRTPAWEHLMDKPSGFGLVRFDKAQRTVTIECYPFGTEFGKPGAPQMDTWPVIVKQQDNYARKPVAWLPTLHIRGVSKPVVQVIDEASGDIVYTLRLSEPRFEPFVFAQGKHTLRVSDPESGKVTEMKGVDASSKASASTLDIAV